MFKTLLKSSFALLAFSLSGCSLYMAPWEKPNPYHYETLPPAPEIIYVPTPRSDLQFGTVPPEAMPPKTYYEENSKKRSLTPATTQNRQYNDPAPVQYNNSGSSDSYEQNYNESYSNPTEPLRIPIE